MKRIFYGLMLFVVCTFTAGASISPDALVKQTTDKVLEELAAKRTQFQTNHELLYRMVDEIVLPHFDFARMSQLVLGRHWRSASEADRERFTDEFKILLVRTYALALFDYNGQKIVYKPFHHRDGEDQAVVKTEIVPADGPPIPLHYALIRNGSGVWKVFDIRIDGVSLVTNYRRSYSDTIQTQGLGSLINSLAEKNKVIQ